MTYYKLYNTIDARNRGYKFNLSEVNKIKYFDEIKDIFHWHKNLNYNFLSSYIKYFIHTRNPFSKSRI